MHSVRRNGMEHIGSRLIHDISSRSHQPFEKFALLVPDEASPLAPEIKPEIAVTFEDPSIKCDVAAKRNLRIAQKTAMWSVRNEAQHSPVAGTEPTRRRVGPEPVRGAAASIAGSFKKATKKLLEKTRGRSGIAR